MFGSHPETAEHDDAVAGAAEAPAGKTTFGSA
jgi:hypothetical protein